MAKKSMSGLDRESENADEFHLNWGQASSPEGDEQQRCLRFALTHCTYDHAMNANISNVEPKQLQKDEIKNSSFFH